MTQESKVAAYERVRRELGVGRMGTGPDAPALPPRAGMASSVSSLPIEQEILGVLLYEYEIWARPGLPLRERSFITMAALTAVGGSDDLYTQVNIALNLGITPEEIHETLLHASVYAGRAAWVTAVGVAREVFLARGILAAGSGTSVEPRPSMTAEERHAARERVTAALGLLRIGLGSDAGPLERLPGPATGHATSRLPVEYDLDPVQGDYGYGEVWGREGLDMRTRSFITMGLLQALHENDQLHLHINNALNIGITPAEIHETLAHVGVYAGVSGWNNATFVARDVFLQRGILDGSR